MAEGETGRMRYPSLTKNLHHEVELVVAIGKGGRDIGRRRAEHVWGYARRPRHDAPRPAGRGEEAGRPWCIGKGFDESAPIGPLRAGRGVQGRTPTPAIVLEVNGAVRQKSTIGKLIWSVPEIIEHLSAAWDLQPGDLIFTGTPEGVAAVVTGDMLKAQIDGLGSLQVQIVAE